MSRSSELVVLDKRKATGLAVFQYWHSCPKCRYSWITESAGYCGGCGTPLIFKGGETAK